jgi:hypothetical protein
VVDDRGEQVGGGSVCTPVGLAVRTAGYLVMEGVWEGSDAARGWWDERGSAAGGGVAEWEMGGGEHTVGWQ